MISFAIAVRGVLTLKRSPAVYLSFDPGNTLKASVAFSTASRRCSFFKVRTVDFAAVSFHLSGVRNLLV